MTHFNKQKPKNLRVYIVYPSNNKTQFYETKAHLDLFSHGLSLFILHFIWLHSFTDKSRSWPDMLEHLEPWLYKNMIRVHSLLLDTGERPYFLCTSNLGNSTN